MHVFVGNFTYVIEFMIVEEISSIIDPRLSQVVLGKPFVEISNMTHDPPEGVVRFTNGTDETAYKIPHKIEHYNSLSDLEKEHTRPVYLRNKEDKRKGEKVSMISKIEPTIYKTPHQHLISNLKMPILHSFEENKLEYEDENEVEIKMMGTEMDKELLEHNLHKNDITLIIFHNFSLTSNPPIKPKNSSSFRMKVVEPLTIHTPPSPHVAYFHRNGRKAYLLEDKQIPSVGVFDEVFSNWMTFKGNTCDLGSFREETDKNTTPLKIIKNCAYRAWRRRRHHKATASGSSS
nr:retrotransposon Orf1 [Tanacetum cinerariifolium]